MKLAAVIVAGVLSVLLGEITMMTWLDISGRFMDVTGNFWPSPFPRCKGIAG